MTLQSVGTPSLWIGFIVFVIAMLALDLGVFHRKAHTVKVREALGWTGIWIALALAFNGLVWHWFGAQRGLEFLTGYVIEKALSVDNLFVFLVVFGFFKVPAVLQHRVLFWGILGALLMRALFIVAGAALIQSFHWIMYVFGGFLVYTGAKLLAKRGEEDPSPEKSLVVRLFGKLVPMTREYHSTHFTVVQAGKRLATPLLLVLVVIEATDIVFAVDSIPAIFAVTQDPFIVFTSNIFAILGLRSLYFALAGMMDKFHHLKTGLGLVLAFVGVKMVIVDFWKVPIAVSLAVISTLLAGSVVASLLWPPVRVPVPQPALAENPDVPEPKQKDA